MYKLLSLDIKQMGKGTPGVIFVAFAGSPDKCLSNTRNNFPKLTLVWAQELKIKNATFRRYLEIAGEAENGEKCVVAKPKKLLY